MIYNGGNGGSGFSKGGHGGAGTRWFTDPTRQGFDGQDGGPPCGGAGGDGGRSSDGDKGGHGCHGIDGADALLGGDEFGLIDSGLYVPAVGQYGSSGNGGIGSGGGGGPSIGIIEASGSVSTRQNVTFQLGEPGLGGDRTDGNGAAGYDGIYDSVYVL